MPTRPSLWKNELLGGYKLKKETKRFYEFTEFTYAEKLEELNKAFENLFLIFLRTFYIDKFMAWLEKKLERYIN